MEIISRKEAIAKGLKRYFTRKPCPKGHVCEKYTNGRTCVNCKNEEFKVWSKNNPEKSKNKSNGWKKNHKGQTNSNIAERRSGKLKRTPSYADLAAIKLFYKNCPSGSVVDHIVPLKGKFVSGFHIETNLQYLTVSENCSKGNRFNAL
jgi:hypothetical protein